MTTPKGAYESPEDVIAASLLAAVEDDRTGDGTPGQVARLVLTALSDAGWLVVPEAVAMRGADSLTRAGWDAWAAQRADPGVSS